MRVKGWTPEGSSAPFCLLAWTELVSELLWPCRCGWAEADDYKPPNAAPQLQQGHHGGPLSYFQRPSTSGKHTLMFKSAG